MFDRAQARMRGEPRRLSNAELINKLQRLLAKQGSLSEITIDKCRGLPSSGMYRYRFGSTFAVYQAIGYRAHSRYSSWNERFRIREIRTRILDEMRGQLKGLGLEMRASPTAVQLWIGEGVSCSFQISTRFERIAGPRWLIRRKEIRKAPFHLIARLGTDGMTVIDFYLVPDSVMHEIPRTMHLQNGPQVDFYRSATMAAIIDRLKRAVNSVLNH